MLLKTSLEESNEIRMLVQSLLDTGKNRLAISSWEDAAGKTTLCRLLAGTLVNTYRKHVVYADLNLRNPSQKNGGRSLMDGVHIEHPELMEVRNLPVGFDDMGAYEKRTAIATLLETKSTDTCLLVDTSPMGVFNRHNIHPVSIREWIPDFVIVVNAGTTSRNDFTEIKELCKSHKLELLGVVVNQFGSEKGPDQASLTHWREAYRILRVWLEPRLPVARRMTVKVMAIAWRITKRVTLLLARMAARKTKEAYQGSRLQLQIRKLWKPISEN